MGEVNVELTLKNGADLTLVSNGHITEQNVRTMTVNAIVDTGAMTLVIGDELRKKLGLEIIKSRTATLAGGSSIHCDIAEAVEVHWKDRTAFIRPWVLQNQHEVLLGVIPLEEMDLMVDPVNNTLVGVHGDEYVAVIR